MCHLQIQVKLQPDEIRTGLKSTLIINRLTGDLSHQKLDPEVLKLKPINIFALLGILKIYGNEFLFYVSDAELVGNFYIHSIFRTRQVSAMAISNSDNQEQKNQKESEYVNQSVFFSYTYDLTQDFYTQTLKDEKVKMAKGHRFWWNFYMQKKFFKQNVSQEWCLRIIQGYIGQFYVQLSTGKQLEYVLISRRDWQRGGTRYNHRGVDEEGNPANYVETEQIVRIDTIISSHVQIRGSVPIFWQQVGIRATSELTKDFEGSKPAFQKHFNQLTKEYKKILCINLMSKEKGNEKILTTNFENQISKADMKNIRYQSIDFHNVCKNYKFENLNHLILEYQDLISSFSFSSYDTHSQKALQEQKGVVRTNCLDCLDRTNVFMTKMALVVLQEMLQAMGINLQKEFHITQTLLWTAEANNDTFPKFILHFKQKWADNGDGISKVYVGTNATTTKMTKQGGGGWTGMFEQSMKGLERFYRQNFEDSQKQDIYELIVGLNQNTDDKVQLINQIEAKLLLEKEEQTSKSFFIINWNLHYNGASNIEFNMKKLFQLNNEKVPDIVIIMMQHVALQENAQALTKWKSLFQELIKQHFGQYELILCTFKFTEIMFIYAQNSFMHQVRKVEQNLIQFTDTQKVSGAMVAKISCKDSTFGIINTSLPQKLSKKQQYLDQINSEAFRKSPDQDVIKKLIYRSQPLFIDQCDFVFMGGDLNCNVQLPNNQISTTLESILDAQRQNQDQAQHFIGMLYPQDQIHIMRKTFLKHFSEPKIQDVPMIYKHKKEDQLQWRNRVLFGTNKGFVSSERQYQTVQGFCEVNATLNPLLLKTNVFEKVIIEADIENQEEQEKEDLQELLYSTSFYQSPLDPSIEDQSIQNNYESANLKLALEKLE